MTSLKRLTAGDFMRRRGQRHTGVQIIRKLRAADAMLNSQTDLAPQVQIFEVSEDTYCR